tara:strand:+ start:701 stop:994 length:294 start_codon:yes stop_codon:yes gene_type:complete
MTDFTKQVADAAEQVKASLPKVSFNANGYEIRTKVLEMAKDHEWSDYHAKFQGWETTATRDPVTGEIITKVTMPVVPGVEQVLSAAEKFYAFVNGNK